tara:strand:+ start:8737 stop:8964 length:228 start_codon:yes stop_codon:yes gene_type:complete
MYDPFFHSFFSPMRTVYIVSDRQLDEIRKKQSQEALSDIEESRKSLEKNYRLQLKALDERETEIKKELKSLTAAK